MKPRLPLPPDRLGPRGEPDATELCPELCAAFDRSYEAVLACDRVDPLVAELVRLRNAGHQGCNLCLTSRSAAALDACGDESVYAAALEFGQASREDQRAALDLAAVFLTDPSPPDPELRARLRREFSNAEVVELVLRLWHYSSNRIRAALRLDNEEAAWRVFE
jgi:alkylhydroperoxidase family enzyme